jgi:hypothetical protein
MSHFAYVPAAASRFCTIVLFAAGCILAPDAGLAQQGHGGGGFTGDHLDPVSGYPCVNQFCDVVRLPGTDCLCAKENPSETVLARLRLSCSAGNRAQSCPAPSRQAD